MKIGNYEFSLKELAGSMGDLGTLLPLAIGYIFVCGLNPAGIFIMMGLANIIFGLVYRIPMPLQPMKVIAVVAIAQRWSPSMVYASGFAMGVIWLFFTATGVMNRVAKIVPHSIVRGVQVTVGVLLATRALRMLSTGWLLGIVSIVIALLLLRNRYAPSAVALAVLGVAIMLIRKQLQGIAFLSFNVPAPTTFRFNDIWQTLLLAGFAQIPLTATNAVISASSLIRTYWPDKPVKEKWLSLNMGILNLIVPFFGGMPMCHGAGGLAGQHYFGARTGGAKIIEGAIQISIGLFMANSVVKIFSAFPTAIVGAMMFLVGIQLARFARDIQGKTELIPMAATILVSLLTNIAYGFAAGLLIHHTVQLILKKQAGFSQNQPIIPDSIERR